MGFNKSDYSTFHIRRVYEQMLSGMGCGESPRQENEMEMNEK